MIISHIIGGIGNQMFQYAVGKACAEARRVELKLDIADFSRYHIHQGFELERVFLGQANYANKAEVSQMLGWRSTSLARRVVRRSGLTWLRGNKLVAEPHFGYWPGISGVGDNSYLTGNWQSEKYFKAIELSLRQDFTFRAPVQGENETLIEEMQDSCAISLHIRRGDYVSNKRANAMHGLSSMAYYQRAIDHVAANVENPHFYIFSDDMSWVNANFKLPFPHRFVTHNSGTESYNDMRLMSSCRHHIIANSSFSWWGAWLNDRHGKIVVAPRHWFASGMDVSDLFCSGWVIL